MEEFSDVGAVGDLKPGSMKEVAVKEQAVLLARVGDKFYATEGRCPHMGGILANGKLEGNVVTCPRHGSQFDVTDGRNIRWTRYTGVAQALLKLAKSPRGLKTYAVKVEGGKIMVKV
jgi:3-phenylpropionate/trans-cinnamate dioxygenase ferredoxin subunit